MRLWGVLPGETSPATAGSVAFLVVRVNTSPARASGRRRSVMLPSVRSVSTRERVFVGETLAGEIGRVVEAGREETVRLLQALVRTPSVTGDEGAVGDVVEGAFRARGLEVDRWEATAGEVAPYVEHVGEQERYEGRPNFVGTRRGRGGGRSLLLNAHVDTVGNGDLEAWTRDPLSGEVVGDLVYGRGSCDMKGKLAAYLAALDALEVLGIRL